MVKDSPQKNEQETIDSSDNNEDKNLETKDENGEIEEDIEMGDISSNLGGYLASKNETEKNIEEESLSKNDGLGNIGNEATMQGTDGEENVEEEVGKEKDLREEEAKVWRIIWSRRRMILLGVLCSLSLVLLK